MGVYSVLLQLLLFSCCSASLTQSQQEFWKSYFSKGPIHLLSGSQDQPLSTPSATISSPNFPEEFSVPAAPHLGYTTSIKTLGYRNIAVFYLSVSGQRCAGSMKVNDNALCIPASGSRASLTNLDYTVYSTNYTDVTVSLVSQLSDKLLGYQIHYQLFTTQNSLPSTDSTVHLPAILATDEGFPSRKGSPKRLPYSYNIILNVFIYQTLNIRLLIADVGNSSCEDTFLLVYGSRLCRDQLNVTVDVGELTSPKLTTTFESRTSYEGAGMLVEITGTPKHGRIDMCSSPVVVYPEETTPFYHLVGPGYPNNNSHIINQCHMQLDSYDMAQVYVYFKGEQVSCDSAEVKIGENSVCGGAEEIVKFDIWGPGSTSVGYEQRTTRPQPSFYILYQPFVFTDICDPKELKNITSLPVNLRSPGLLTERKYPNGVTCYVTVHVPSVTHIDVTIRKFDLEESGDCKHDYLQIGNYSRECGNRTSHSKVLTVPEKFLVIFRSDRLHQYEGFALSIDDATPIKVTTGQSSTGQSSTDQSSTGKSSTGKFSTDQSSINQFSSSVESTTGALVTPRLHPFVPRIPSKKTTPNEPKQQTGKKGRTPSYVWAIVVVLCLAVCAVIVAVIVIRRRRRNAFPRYYPNADDEQEGVDLGFENPTYGDGERVRFTRQSSAESG